MKRIVGHDTERMRAAMRETGFSPKSIALFRRIILRSYRRHGRPLPWRRTRDPYRVLVSEVMLQQTQVPRVVEKYRVFIRLFPDFLTLSAASLRDVLGAWQGLGYNRRALSLKRLAVQVVEQHAGRLPEDRPDLLRLPGIGPYTAAAVRVFAFSKPEVMIETNIRSVFIHFLFGDGADVRDRDILPLVEQTLDRDDPRTWYNALMDYGVMLKQVLDNPSRRSTHYRRQGRFHGSDRQLRGMILRMLAVGSVRQAALAAGTGGVGERLDRVLSGLVRDGLIRRGRRGFVISS